MQLTDRPFLLILRKKITNPLTILQVFLIEKNILDILFVTCHIACMKYSKLKQMRQRRNLTQKQLADAAKVSQSSISRAEKGERALSFQNINKLAECFNMSIPQFLREATDD